MSSVVPARLPAAGRTLLSALVALVLATALLAHAAPTATAASGRNAPAAAKRHPVLTLGSRGPAVAYLQRRLGIWDSGVFRKPTKRAVIGYERRHGFTPDGKVGPGIWKSLGVPYQKSQNTKAERRAKILRVAAAQAGKPYRYGATGPNAFDCSGFVGYVVRKAIGKQLPRTSRAIRAATKPLAKKWVRPGDLVFGYTGGRVTHVGIVAGNGRWWEATRPGRPVAKNKAWTSNVSYARIV